MEVTVGLASRRTFESRYITIYYWRRMSESNDVFAGCQPKYPDLQGHFNIDSKGLQAAFGTIRHLQDLTRHAHLPYSVIEEFVGGFMDFVKMLLFSPSHFPQKYFTAARAFKGVKA
jgi:hypothetical protein